MESKIPNRLNYHYYLFWNPHFSRDNFYQLQTKAFFLRFRTLSLGLKNNVLQVRFKQLKKSFNRLSKMKDIIDWNRNKPQFYDIYKNDIEKGGIQHLDPVFTKNNVSPHSRFSLVEEAMGIKLYPYIRSMNFFGQSKTVPDGKNIQQLRELIADNYNDKKIKIDLESFKCECYND